MVSNKVDVEHDDIELEQGHGDNVEHLNCSMLAKEFNVSKRMINQGSK